MKYTWFDYDDLYNHISITWVFTLEFRVERFEQLTLKLQEDSIEVNQVIEQTVQNTE